MLFRAALLAVLACSLAGCENGTGPSDDLPEPPVAISPDSLTLTIGSIAKFSVTDTTGALVHGPVFWSSLDPTFAAVDSAGNVTALESGMARIRALVGTRADTVVVYVPEPARFESISAGAYHSCALTDAGVAYCWGDTGEWACVTPGAVWRSCSKVPVLAAEGRSFKQLSAGVNYTCGVTAEAALYCWPESGDLSMDGIAFAQVGAGMNGGCGLSVDGDVYCWDGRGAFRPPAKVSGSTRFRTISVAHGAMTARRAVCGIEVGGDLYCWRLGENPELVETPEKLIALDLGGGHGCALGDSGRAYCWGQNHYGALGDGTTTESEDPVAVVGEMRWKQISAGDGFTCAVTVAGAAHCWGDSAALGTETEEKANTTPLMVSGGLYLDMITAGGGMGQYGHHSCGITDGHYTYCWGGAMSGQLGNGQQQRDGYNHPVAVWPLP